MQASKSARTVSSAALAGAAALVCAGALVFTPAAGAATHHRHGSRHAHGARHHRRGHHANARHRVRVTVKVLGRPPAYKKLLKRTVTLRRRPVARFGGSCTGMSAAGALQLATKGKWAGTWDSEFSDYEVTKIDGLNLPFKTKAAADWYWKFTLDGKEASAGICAVHPHSGQRLLFKPACYGTACPKIGKKASAGAADRRRHQHHRHHHRRRG